MGAAAPLPSAAESHRPMVLWFIFGVMTMLVVGIVLWPLRHSGQPDGQRSDYALRIYRDQLREVNQDVSRKVLNEEEAESARLEIKRRMLAEPTSDAAAEGDQRTLARLAKLAPILLAVLIPFAAMGLYAELGSPDAADRPLAVAVANPHAELPSPPQAQPLPNTGSQSGLAEVSVMVQRLAARLAVQPDDPEGWRMLGWSYLNTGRYDDAAEAYGRAVEQSGDDPKLRSAQGEAIVRAAGGMVTDEAKGSFEAALALDSKDPRARFFVGLSKEQKGDKQGALDDWVAVLAEAPADATWVPDLRKRISDLGEELGLDRAELPVSEGRPPKSLAAAFPGPTAADIENAQGMAAEDRQAMIHDMVARLAQRLEENPQDFEGWMKLARSRKVLGQTDAARSALRRAAEIFQGDPQAQEGIRRSARELGLELGKLD